jgi:putative hydrolase of the HAD superfamily
MRVRAITLDLDDTLWPIGPVMPRAEQRLDLAARALSAGRRPVSDRGDARVARRVAAANPTRA